MPESDELSAKELKYFQAVSEIKVNTFFPVDEAMNALNFLWGESYDDLDLGDLDDLDLDLDLEDSDDLPEIEEEQVLSDKSLPDLDEDVLYQKSTGDEVDEQFSEPQFDVSRTQGGQIDWLIGFSDEFQKSVKKIDKRVKGRIYEAIEQISKSPVQQKGNTIKPLSAKLKGLWRYRVGDYRLVYMPDSKNRTVTLVVFSARGGAYQ